MDTLGRILRIREAIRGALDAAPPSKAAVAAREMTSAYERYRSEAAGLLDEGYLDEFERMFPELDPPPPSKPWWRIIRRSEQREQYSKARVLLDSLAGWLDGFIAEARMKLKAREAAEALIREEREGPQA